jgi:hypothetical protein
MKLKGGSGLTFGFWHGTSPAVPRDRIANRQRLMVKRMVERCVGWGVWVSMAVTWNNGCRGFVRDRVRSASAKCGSSEGMTFIPMLGGSHGERAVTVPRLRWMSPQSQNSDSSVKHGRARGTLQPFHSDESQASPASQETWPTSNSPKSISAIADFIRFCASASEQPKAGRNSCPWEENARNHTYISRPASHRHTPQAGNPSIGRRRDYHGGTSPPQHQISSAPQSQSMTFAREENIPHGASAPAQPSPH